MKNEKHYPVNEKSLQVMIIEHMDASPGRKGFLSDKLSDAIRNGLILKKESIYVIWLEEWPILAYPHQFKILKNEMD